MKKFLCAAVVGMCLISASSMAQRPGADGRMGGACSYTPLQEIIRDARSEADLAPIIKNNINVNAPVKCGGTALQLAVLRGNPKVVRTLLEAGGDVKTLVSTDGFNMPGAPKEIPLLHFAGFFAPREDIVRLIISANADVAALDAKGDSVLWYINQNPVLRNTDLSDEIRNTLLLSALGADNAEGAPLDTPSGSKQVKGVISNADGKPVMRKVVDPRVPQLAPGQRVITKSDKNAARPIGPVKTKGQVPDKNNVQTLDKDKVSDQTQKTMDDIAGDALPQMPQGSRVIAPQSAFGAREIVEPDMPVGE